MTRPTLSNQPPRRFTPWSGSWPAITSKNKYYANADAIGNHPLITTEPAIALQHGGLWAVRGLQLGTSFWWGPGSSCEAIAVFLEAPRKRVLSEFIPTEKIVVQGEFGCTPVPQLRTTTVKTILKHIHNVPHVDFAGLAALAELRRISRDAEWIEELSTMSGSVTDPVVVEFTVFDEPVGHLHRETVIWEMRSY